MKHVIMKISHKKSGIRLTTIAAIGCPPALKLPAVVCVSVIIPGVSADKVTKSANRKISPGMVC
jgi:hypothetical protein